MEHYKLTELIKDQFSFGSVFTFEHEWETIIEAFDRTPISKDNWQEFLTLAKFDRNAKIVTIDAPMDTITHVVFNKFIIGSAYESKPGKTGLTEPYSVVDPFFFCDVAYRYTVYVKSESFLDAQIFNTSSEVQSYLDTLPEKQANNAQITYHGSPVERYWGNDFARQCTR